jgi:putative membrane protein
LRDVIRLQGLVVMTVTLVTTLWLAATGQLVLYIHPRYVVFTVIMALVGLALVIADLVARLRRSRGGREQDGHAALDDHGHGHDHDEEPQRRRGGRLLVGGSAALVLVVTAGLLLLEPTTLSSATAEQRAINSTTVGADAATVTEATDAADSVFAGFTVLDWSSLLRQSSDVSFYQEKPVDVTGFITEDPDGADDIFYVSRFVITCCAVDAQPVGVPVHLPDWRSTYSEDQWVTVKGGFTVNPSAGSTQPIALEPDDVAVVEQPSDPYLF